MPAFPLTGDTQQAEADLSSSETQESEGMVVFRGDGEPPTPRALVQELARLESEGGLDPDNYSLGGTVEELERRFADTLGKEAAIFMPTGTLANHLAIRALCGGKPRAVVQEQSHIYNDTGDGVTQLSGINLIPLGKDEAYFTLEELKAAISASSSGRVANPIGAVVIESPVRRQMGQVVPFEEMVSITDYCRAMGIGAHLDGARLYMMSAASGIGVKEYCSLFDTAYVSLYKYFGAPFGAILAGDSAMIDGMFHTRRMFGGGLASSYLAAALALKGLDGFEERFQAALNNGRDLFKMLDGLPGINVKEFANGSNIFPLSFDSGVDIEGVVSALRQRGIRLYPDEGTTDFSRLTVNTTILRQSNDAIFNAFQSALGKP